MQRDLPPPSTGGRVRAESAHQLPNLAASHSKGALPPVTRQEIETEAETETRTDETNLETGRGTESEVTAEMNAGDGRERGREPVTQKPGVAARNDPLLFLGTMKRRRRDAELPSLSPRTATMWVAAGCVLTSRTLTSPQRPANRQRSV
mmetsp:Transcript_24102/g.47413  ORF Transcript_24102/g.47413 Transcript_24102/m.47413 type:complete len:149 (+) Transcript_24102:141-587(+)